MILIRFSPTIKRWVIQGQWNRNSIYIKRNEIISTEHFKANKQLAATVRFCKLYITSLLSDRKFLRERSLLQTLWQRSDLSITSPVVGAVEKSGNDLTRFSSSASGCVVHWVVVWRTTTARKSIQNPVWGRQQEQEQAIKIPKCESYAKPKCALHNILYSLS